jgi:hypothetical protein
LVLIATASKRLQVGNLRPIVGSALRWRTSAGTIALQLHQHQ